MSRSLLTLLLVALLSTALHGDITVTTVTTLEGGAAAMAGNVTPRVIMRIRGLKARTDVEAMGNTISTVADLAAHTVFVLRPDEKTAQLIEATSPPAGVNPQDLPKVDGSFTPTGRTQQIEGVACDEYAFNSSIAMGSTAQGSPDAATMMQGLRMTMKGSVWSAKGAPGAAEYSAFQKAALAAQLLSTITGGTTGAPTNDMEKVLRGLTGGDGMPYLTEMTMTIEGTGPAADFLRQMGEMKLTSKITSVSTDPIPDDMFAVPKDYTIVKR